MSQVTTGVLAANGLEFVIDEAGSGDAVALCLHGFPESRFSWRHQLPMLADLGWRAVAPDLRGYGHSSRPAGKANYHVNHLIEDVAGMFEALGARRRLLLAHDWGALIAWVYAMQGRLPLDGLVIMNVPHPGVFDRIIRSSWRQRMRSWYVAFFQLPGLPELMMTARGGQATADAFRGMAVDKSRFPDEVLEVYRKNATIPGAMTAMINYYRANTDLTTRFGGVYPVIEVPTLMVWGEEDAALGAELTEGYGPFVRDFTLKRLPGVSHWVQQEAPEAVNAEVERWMKGKGLA